MTNLVSRLLEAITETERLAGYRDDDWRTDPDSWHTRSCGFGQGELMEDCGCEVPSSVLRRCAADRKLLNMCRSAERQLERRRWKTEAEREQVVGAATMAAIAVAHLAEGYGLSGHREGDNG